MTGGDPLLAAQQLCAGRGTPLLRGVDLEFRAAQSWFVLGRNGSGKSTLLATLVGLLRPLGGAVRWHGDLAGRRRLGYVPQEQRFAPPLPCTVAEFVALGLPDREARAAVRDCVAAALAAMEIGGLAARAVQTLSVGQRRRAMVARALARRPRLLLLDEPTANLDGHGAALLARDLERLREQQRLCVVHVAHDLGLARRFATHVALVDGGAVVAG
ncbi:MAG: ABC transporter ATP-binding protein, partial [Planctomycetes bacterium]|nr:ABC transporter ATP-binding protein [Planctomycetota bacterium]